MYTKRSATLPSTKCSIETCSLHAFDDFPRAHHINVMCSHHNVTYVVARTYRPAEYFTCTISLSVCYMSTEHAFRHHSIKISTVSHASYQAYIPHTTSWTIPVPPDQESMLSLHILYNENTTFSRSSCDEEECLSRMVVDVHIHQVPASMTRDMVTFFWHGLTPYSTFWLGRLVRSATVTRSAMVVQSSAGLKNWRVHWYEADSASVGGSVWS